MTWSILEGDAATVLATLEPGSAQTVVTSPPYWGLRDYGTAAWEGGDAACEHIQEGREPERVGGRENRGGDRPRVVPTPYRHVCGRCGAVRIDSQIGLELTPEAYVSTLVEVFRQVRRVLRDDGTVWLNLGDSYASNPANGGPQSDKLAGPQNATPTRLYQRPSGLKPKDLVGIPWRVAFGLQADGWYLRSDVIWAKPNPMPESVTDRPTKAHEYVFLLSKSARYFYDADAVREGSTNQGGAAAEFFRPDAIKGRHSAGHVGWGNEGRLTGREDSGYRNLRSVWNIPTEPFPEAHFATFPKALVEPCVKAGSKVGDTVLDPFAGSGTTGVVALRLGRSFVGIELSKEYAEMARKSLETDRSRDGTLSILNGQP